MYAPLYVSCLLYSCKAIGFLQSRISKPCSAPTGFVTYSQFIGRWGAKSIRSFYWYQLSRGKLKTNSIVLCYKNRASQSARHVLLEETNRMGGMSGPKYNSVTHIQLRNTFLQFRKLNMCYTIFSWDCREWIQFSSIWLIEIVVYPELHRTWGVNLRRNIIVFLH